jgi:hypothetical protein
MMGITFFSSPNGEPKYPEKEKKDETGKKYYLYGLEDLSKDANIDEKNRYEYSVGANGGR